MRTQHIVLALALSSTCLLPTALAQAPNRASLSDYTPAHTDRRADTAEERRRLARGGGGNLRSYGQSELDQIARQQPKNPLRFMYGLALVLFIFLFCAPFALKLYRDNQKRLAAEASFGRNSEGGAAAAAQSRYSADLGSTSNKLATLEESAENRPSVPLVSPEELRERVWNTLLDAQKWLSAEGVARLARLDPEQARGELQELVREGHIELSKDRTGRPIYKMTA